jgi:hypothetical protein
MIKKNGRCFGIGKIEGGEIKTISQSPPMTINKWLFMGRISRICHVGNTPQSYAILPSRRSFGGCQFSSSTNIFVFPSLAWGKEGMGNGWNATKSIQPTNHSIHPQFPNQSPFSSSIPLLPIQSMKRLFPWEFNRIAQKNSIE